ncbi:hypothetical protein GGS23DRAFT_184810 [Durotheca rogersii]|uniref:uncharacterized protein n=1 Tax=Durotheca rogersii TaxID=419775 RepID=UPI00221F6C5A|nr:uncharacterized protein GGS23DRAFT_184810 [Durotheca rogersii]KAI5867592.1 hypothetical protein GGS23DRAFT_184810 [Durotheca rogersii]
MQREINPERSSEVTTFFSIRLSGRGKKRARSKNGSRPFVIYTPQAGSQAFLGRVALECGWKPWHPQRTLHHVPMQVPSTGAVPTVSKRGRGCREEMMSKVMTGPGRVWWQGYRDGHGEARGLGLGAPAGGGAGGVCAPGPPPSLSLTPTLLIVVPMRARTWGPMKLKRSLLASDVCAGVHVCVHRIQRRGESYNHRRKMYV